MVWSNVVTVALRDTNKWGMQTSSLHSTDKFIVTIQNLKIHSCNLVNNNFIKALICLPRWNYFYAKILRNIYNFCADVKLISSLTILII